MKRKLRRFFAGVLKNSFFLEYLYNNYFLYKNKRIFLAEVDKRKTFSIFNYQELAAELPFCPFENIKDSNYYGHAMSMKKYCGASRITSGIEHGIYLGNRITDAEKLRTTKSVIAMSKNRVESFQECGINKPVLAVGPYIHYTEGLMDTNSFNKLKTELGKTLLVFPFHSGIFQTMSFDIDLLIDHIETNKKDFDSVLVCLHHLDVERNQEYTKKYEEKGYRVVCAGHKYDLNFLPRLRTIISLADFVVSNSIGTQVGYCAYLGKPQRILFDNSSLEALNYLHVYSDTSGKIAYEQTMEIINAFKDNYQDIITERQKLVLEKYWGFSCIKSPSELRKEIESLNEKY